MPVTKDDSLYDELHNRLLRDILLAVKDELDGADLDEDLVHELTAAIGTAISNVLDGSAPVEVGGEPLVPFVAFARESQRDHLIVNDHGSYFHEVIDSLFDEISEEEEEAYEDEEDDDEDDYEYEEDEDEGSGEEDEVEYDEDLEEEEQEEDDDAQERRH